MAPTPNDPTYVILPRGEGDTLTTEANRIASEVTPSGLGFQTTHAGDLADHERQILRELRELLPNNIIFPEDGPFVVLKIAGEDEARTSLMGSCACRCGGGDGGNCGGGGSGG